MSIFSFTNTKPTSENIWEELVKTTMPKSGLLNDLIRAMMWIMLCAGKDFKKSKKVVNSVLDDTMTVDTFRNHFTMAIEKKYNVTISPISFKMPSNPELCKCDSQRLLTPILIFKDIFKGIDNNILSAIAESVWDITDGDLYTLLLDNDTLSGSNAPLTAYSAQLLPDEILFTDNFRQYFHSEYDEDSPDIYEINNMYDLERTLRNWLVNAINGGEQFVKLPKIVMVGSNTEEEHASTYPDKEGDNCEA